MTSVVVCASRKGGVGKSTVAYELAAYLDAILLDLEWDGGSVTKNWGYRSEQRVRHPLMSAIENGRTPRALKGYRKPDLVPGSAELVNIGWGSDEWADTLSNWVDAWKRDWVVIDTHPGASEATHGAMAIANAVVVPTTLRTKDLDGTEQMQQEMGDFPLIIVPNMIPRVPPAAEVKRLTSIVEGTQTQVGPPIPMASAVGTRKKRMAMLAEDPVPKAIAKPVEALQQLGEFVKGYVR